MAGWVFDDGGREASGYRGRTGDCVVRALAIATGENYGDLYREAAAGMARVTGTRSARSGVSPKVYGPMLSRRGFIWVPLVTVGSRARVHLSAGELIDAGARGRVIVRLSRHLCAVIDGTVRDTYDPSRGGRRMVYGYWHRPAVG